MSPLPELNTRRLLDAITAHQDLKPLSGFEVAQIRRDAKSLMDRDASEAHMVLGALACELFDIEAMRSHHLTSIQFNPGNLDARSNFVISLSRSGFTQEAIEALQELVRRAPEYALEQCDADPRGIWGSV